MGDFPQCIRACQDPQDTIQATCDTGFFAATTTKTAPSDFTYSKEFTPSLTGGILGGSTGCIGSGVLSSPAFVYTFTPTPDNINTWKWYCVEPESSKVSECNVTYSCQGTRPANSEVCKYSFDANETKTDYE